ncbi:MAG: AzlC family ABC transporter permease [Clostridia bacterium]|nr:AzlC family ABC transporter permease [Clostridia bacterium]
MKSKILKEAFLDTLPVLSGYMVLGIGFGILLENAGYGVFWAFIMSLFIYAGSMQYAGVELMISAAQLPVVALTTLMVNARHLFYGISMIDKYKGAGAKKPYMIFALTDETYSLVCSKQYENKKDAHRYFFYVSVMNQCYWVAGSVIGSLIGTALPFDTTGIEFSMTALFVTVFVEQWISTKKHLPAILGVLISAVCLLIFGKESFLIPAMVIIILMLVILKGRCSENE